MVVQSDRKILIGGIFTSVMGVKRNGIARLNPDGTLDSSFDPGAGANGVVACLAQKDDGRIVIGGTFTTFDGIPRNQIALLLGDDFSEPLELLGAARVGESFSVSVKTMVGKKYLLETRKSLSEVTWTALPAILGDGSAKILIDSSATGSERYYRVRME
jgi:hypothetical protein